MQAFVLILRGSIGDYDEIAGEPNCRLLPISAQFVPGCESFANTCLDVIISCALHRQSVYFSVASAGVWIHPDAWKLGIAEGCLPKAPMAVMEST